MASLVIYWTIALISGGGLLYAALSGDFSEHYVWGQAISTAFITASIGLIFALNVDWADRYRILSIIPLIIHGIGWIVWGLIGESTLMI